MSKVSILLSIIIVMAVSPLAAAQPFSEQMEGRPVLGADGALLGVVEKVVLNSKGRPAQVLVRPKDKKASGPHSLAFASLDQTSDGFVAPLTRAEFDAMPAVELDPAER